MIIVPRNPSARNEKGVVLVVSLLMLFVMTVIGVSALRTSSLDMRIVANAKEQVTAFHLAETALEAAMENAGSDISVYQSAITTGAEVTGPTIDTGLTGTTVAVTIEDMGVNEEAYAKGSSIKFKARRFKLTGSAERTGSHARDVHQRGFELLIPGS